jgi:hypothetical protein
MRTTWLALALVATLAPGAEARELEDILREKGVIDDVEANETKAAREKKEAPALSPLPDWFNKTTFSGDVRVRGESFWRKDDPDRVRQRFRLRFGARVAVNRETELGLQLASGTANDPISNNQTFTDVFTFKSINVSNAYLKLAPTGTFGWPRPYVTVMGGKFTTPTWHPTRMMFDGDLTPEGFFEVLKLAESTSGALRGVSFNMGQWVFVESSRTGDGALFPFQGVANFAFGDDVLANFAFGDFHYQKEQLIAAARNRNTDLAITNDVTLSDGSVAGGFRVDPAKTGPNKDGKDASGKAITITGFENDFNVVDLGGDVNVRTGSPRWPLRFFGEYAINTEAASDDTGYQVGAGIGPTKDPGDLSLSYAWQSLETNAVVSAFANSDFGRDGGTNSEGHILQLNYMLPFRGMQFTSTCWFVEPIDDVAGRNPQREVRWQVDFLAKF